MGKLITLVIIVALAGGGYLWYNHAKETRIRAEKTARVEQANARIAELTIELEKVKAEQPEAMEALNKADAELNELRKKMDEFAAAERNADDRVSAARQEDRNNAQRAAQSKSNSTQQQGGEVARINAEIAALNNAAASGETEVKKLDCHYNCMKRSKQGDATKTSDPGKWTYLPAQRITVWICKTHGYQFTKTIEYLDYSNQKAKAEAQVKNARKRAAALEEALVVARRQATVTNNAPIATTGTSLVDDARRVLDDIRQKKRDIEFELRKMERAKGEAESKINDFKRKIERTESEIDQQKKIIAENL